MSFLPLIRRLFWLFVLLACAWPQAQGRLLSNRARIHLLTVAPGAELYSAFGHTAIWVQDPLAGINTVYNYGTFDFQQGKLTEFYLNFLQGRLNYRLEIESYREFDYVYHYFQRSYTSQVLDLTQEQKQAVYDFLEYNYLPENRFYLYEFFYDNCATRVRDLFTTVLGDTVLQWHEPEQLMEATYRDLLWEYLRDRRWVGFGIDLILGAVVDEPITPWQSMFLPDYLALEVGQAQLTYPGDTVALVSEKNLLFEGEAAVRAEPWFLWPITIWTVLLVATGLITYLGWQRQRWWRGIDVGIFFLSGLAGLVMLLLWTATIHTAVVENWNLMWLWPTHLIAGLMLIGRPRPWLRYYFLPSAALTLLTVLGWFIIPQTFHPAFLPWMLILALRGLYVARMLSPQTRTVPGD